MGDIHMLDNVKNVLNEKVATTFDKSLTEEQRLMQSIISGEMKVISHDEVVKKLEYVLKNGLDRK